MQNLWLIDIIMFTLYLFSSFKMLDINFFQTYLWKGKETIKYMLAYEILGVSRHCDTYLQYQPGVGQLVWLM